MMPARSLRRSFNSGAAVALLTIATAFSPANAADGPLFRWQFRQNLADGKTFKAVAGGKNATTNGPVRFSKTIPHALLLDGDSKARRHIAVATDLKQLKLPQRAISVEAWVLVDKPAEWGGICGIIQDNGDYERGWLLGHRNSQFCFAVSSSTKKRLTYLTDPRSFEFGYWYHVVGTYDGKQMTLHVDGKLRAASKEQSGDIAYPPNAPFTIGAYHDDNELYSLAGQIEQVSVYDRSLSTAEIGARFKARLREFPEIEAVTPQVADWPTYLRDNQRSGISTDKLNAPLHAAWVYRSRHPPQPAWPAPAKQNFWHKKYNLKPRVIYDRAYHVVSDGNAAYFASSADDKVYCLDATTGGEKWSFFTEGPVRLAPTLHVGKVLFGSDDGHVYCLNSANGSLMWKYRHDAAEERQIAGNGRVISSMPVRTGVLVDENIAYFCAGLFPNQAVYQVALDVKTGKKLASGKINVSAQGYLERRSGKLFVPGGRDPAGAFASQLKRRGKGIGKEISKLPEEYPYAFIGAAGVRFGGGDGKVTAFRADDGKEIWTAKVTGKAYGLSIAGGRLFVSTDAGLVYCFGQQEQLPREISPAANKPLVYASEQLATQYKTTAQELLAESKVRQGFCLVLENGNGHLAYELARHSDLKIVCVEANAEKVTTLRRRFDAAGLSGRVVVHHRSPTGKLPYTDYLFNLIVGDSLVSGGKLPGDRDEITRVLRPGGGVAFLGVKKSEIVRRPSLKGIGEWTHMYANAANTVCSTDTRVRGKMAMQWFGRPGPRQMIDRHHRTVAPLWKDGRLFIPGDNRIYAADAYNGTPLWTVEIPNSRRVGAFRDCSYMAAGTGFVYVAVDDKCMALNAETGYAETTFRVPMAKDGKKREWGYVANVEKLLIGSGVKPGASRRGHSLAAIHDAAYFDFRHAVTSDFVFAFDQSKAAHQWTYHSDQGAIPNSTITVGGGKMFFVESRNAETINNPKGRAPLTQLLGKGADLVAIDMHTGKVAWRIDAKCTAAEHNLYCSYADDKLVVVGSRNSGSNKETARVLFDVFVFDTKSGKPVWNTTQNQATKINGDHGEQDLHPIIVGNKLYCEPFAYELQTGKKIANWGWDLGKRRGCGTISASASAFFFRQSNPTMFDLTTHSRTPVTTSTRPGCWINIIPAGGLLLIPEASSGCTCDYAVQTSLAFLPVE
ncbi:MAG: PQQ-binding-like beta-propeller repeat protein [Planctomycetaceae bacterium]|jgi:outer membrane protein assembly factor BamB|nr:PQQ-binding-like beta-propeller repeat protein [Planctomycetaceae bacterium]MBT6486009.1 PQQ-binding-like beta-propeller repeat protein [Planctomycetaceae bacterium]